MFIESDAQREYLRVHFNRYLDIEFISDKYEHCQVTNLSLDGMFINGKFKKHEGDFCNIELEHVGSTTELSLNSLAKVVRQDEKGIAIKFSSMPFESYLYLQTSLLYEAEDSFLLNKMLKEDCPFEVTDGPPLSGEIEQ